MVLLFILWAQSCSGDFRVTFSGPDTPQSYHSTYLWSVKPGSLCYVHAPTPATPQNDPNWYDFALCLGPSNQGMEKTTAETALLLWDQISKDLVFWYQLRWQQDTSPCAGGSLNVYVTCDLPGSFLTGWQPIRNIEVFAMERNTWKQLVIPLPLGTGVRGSKCEEYAVKWGWDTFICREQPGWSILLKNITLPALVPGGVPQAIADKLYADAITAHAIGSQPPTTVVAPPRFSDSTVPSLVVPSSPSVAKVNGTPPASVVPGATHTDKCPVTTCIIPIIVPITGALLALLGVLINKFAGTCGSRAPENPSPSGAPSTLVHVNIDNMRGMSNLPPDPIVATCRRNNEFTY